MKSFKKIAIAIIGICCAVAWMPKITAKAMELDNDEFDAVFLKTVEEYVYDNCYGDIELVAGKELLYDIDINTIGYIYDFTLNAEDGYAIVVNSNGYPEVAEIYFNSVNPLKDVEDKRIYITNSLYVYYQDTSYYLTSGEEISAEGVEALRDIAYYSSDAVITTSSETIYYTTKVETDAYQMAKRHPAINKITGYSNACVPLAGANIIQYWDRYLPNLIENYTPGIAAGSYYLYNTPNNVLTNMAIELYNLMGTSTAGATISQFKSGMNSYCSRKGYSISYESCMSSGRLNYTLAKEKMRNGRPMVIFADPFTVATISSSGNSDNIEYFKASAGHSVAGFGYKDIQYTLSTGQTRTDNYIEIASGLADCAVGYYNINYDTTIYDAYAVYIY
ncbi:MAG: hypothetical protein K2M17_06325 [Bacilli bacterium]|nr:hypothetical protein [Bacilli bacterium]